MCHSGDIMAACSSVEINHTGSVYDRQGRQWGSSMGIIASNKSPTVNRPTTHHSKLLLNLDL